MPDILLAAGLGLIMGVLINALADRLPLSTIDFDIEEEELEIARLQPWHGGPAIFAADGLFGFGAQLEEP